MDSRALGIIIALLVAAIVSVIDLSVHRDKGFYFRALPLCALFAILDAAAAIILFIPLGAGAEHLESSPITAAAVVAGLTGPLMMRTKIPVPFTKGEKTVNAVAMLRWLQIQVASDIKELCAVGETEWILYKVLPSLAETPSPEVQKWVIESITVKYSGVEARKLREKCIKDVTDAAGDVGTEEDRKHRLIQVLIDHCGRRPVIALIRRAKKQLRTVGKDFRTEIGGSGDDVPGERTSGDTD